MVIRAWDNDEPSQTIMPPPFHSGFLHLFSAADSEFIGALDVYMRVEDNLSQSLKKLRDY